MKLTDEQGKLLLNLAKAAVSIRLNSSNDNAFNQNSVKYEEKFDRLINLALQKNSLDSSKLPEFLQEKRGVFVTINKGINLRGCIGFSETEKELYRAVIEAAVCAAFGDPRFPPLKSEEYNKIHFEVSVLTIPDQVDNNNPELLFESLKLGVDGLIVKAFYGSALLLPQVALEYAMNRKEFLEAVCIKAGLKKDAWKYKDTKVFKFQAQVFKDCEL